MFSLFTFLLAVANLHAITNNRVQREFDTKGNLFFAKYTISFMHESNEELPTSYIFPLEFPIDKMSSISFTLNGSNVKAKYDTEAKTFSVPLPSSFKADVKYELVVKGIFFEITRPVPDSITQEEIQAVRLEGDLQFNSPYFTNADDLYILAHTMRYLSASAEITFQLDSELFYSHNNNVKPHEVKQFYVHYMCPTGFLSLPKYEREVIISHIAPSRVQERITAKNTGARFKGEYNGLQNLIRRNPDDGTIREMVFNVPTTAADFSYRDDIGNISSSYVAQSPLATQLHIEPRFPLHGGWQTSFYIEYYLPFTSLNVSLPVKTFARKFGKDELFFSDSPEEQAARQMSLDRRFHISVPLAPSLQYGAADEAVVRIALPEGASDVAITAAMDGVTKDSKEEVTHHVMDYIGRRTLIVRRRNVVNSPFFGNIVVHYNLSPLYFIHKPLILIGLCLFIFTTFKLAMGLIHWFKRGDLSEPLKPGATLKDD